MVLRRSTTDWTWLSPFSSVARSIVAFMVFPRPAELRGVTFGTA
jgi:hypothetical protein